MQPGDIVESVDMEMSDDETDSKPKGRVLVDLRLQDRDMRVGAPPTAHHDMDMRMIPLPIGQMPGPRDNQLMQDVHLMRSGPPPPPPPPQFQHQGGFRQEQEFSHCKQSVDFHPNQPKFQQNRAPNFLRNQQDFHSNQQEFHQLHQSQQQDFEYCDREHNIRSKQDFLAESPGRGRYSQSADHQHHDNSSFHRNEWNNRGGGRGFSRNRRDRYSEDHNIQKQRNNLINSRKSRSQDQQHHQSSSEILPNNRSLLQPPDTTVIFNEEGMPEFDQDNNTISNKADVQTEPEHDSDNCQSSLASRQTSHDIPSSHDSEHNQQQQQSYQLGPEQRTSSSIESEDQSSSINQVMVIPIRTDNAGDEPQQKQHVPISECEEHVESTEHSDLAEKISATDNEPINQGQNVNFTEKESLDESMTSTTSGKEMKRTANGDCGEQSHEEGSPNKKRPFLQNGPQTLNDDLSGPNGPTLMTESHPAMMYEYDGPNFRPRIGAPFPLWRGGPPPPSSRGGRGGFRGGLVGMPRGPWLDRGPRGPAAGNFSPRGLKRGGKQFWGGGFRGRGRGSNW